MSLIKPVIFAIDFSYEEVRLKKEKKLFEKTSRDVLRVFLAIYRFMSSFVTFAFFLNWNSDAFRVWKEVTATRFSNFTFSLTS